MNSKRRGLYLIEGYERREGVTLCTTWGYLFLRRDVMRDKVLLDCFVYEMESFWGIDALEDFSRDDTLLLDSWEKAIERTVAIFPVGGDVLDSIMVTLDGDQEYCVWESAFLQEAWGTDAWFSNKEEAIRHAEWLAKERVAPDLEEGYLFLRRGLREGDGKVSESFRNFPLPPASNLV